MATATTDIELSAANQGFVTRVWNALMRSAEQQAHKASRRAQIEALEQKSDADLAKLGLRREDIAHYVFRDLYYA